jgi:hypothetical protein
MASIKIQGFAGVAPRYSPRLLPQAGAVTAANVKLLSGELRGLHETQVLYDFNPLAPPNPIARAYRLPLTVGAPIPISGSDEWIGFSDANVDFVRTPVLEDSFERYYWTGDSTRLGGVPQYNTRARINANLASPGSAPSFVLGVPTPVNSPTVAPPAGINLTRAYLYTFVSAYGEEGPPCLPTTATGTNGTWVISGFDTSIPSASNYNITTIRIYRTVSGTTETEYYFVADISLGTTTYNDTQADAIVALNFTIPSITWTPPPATLEGIIAHPGGFMVGFSGRDLWLSEPYQPHAWPVQYIQTMQTEIVGVAIFNNCIIVTTTSHPYIGTGMSPLSVTLQKLDSIDPCVSRRSMAVTLAGVFYASPQGIIMNDSTQSTLVTQQLFTREEWQEQFSPTTVYAVPYGMQYIAFDTTATGFIFSPAESNAPLTTLDRFSDVTAIQIDAYSGDVYLVQSNQIRLWDPPESLPYTYTWVSKQFDLPKPVNFGAFKLKFAANPYQINVNQLNDYIDFNNARLPLAPLNPLNWAALNTARQTPVTGSVLPQIKNPLGGSPLYNIGSLTNQPAAVSVTVYARDLNSDWIAQYTNTITTERTYRLPAGFKSDGWYVQFIGNTNVYSWAMAETPKELQND